MLMQEDVRQARQEITGRWGWFLVSGIAWLVISLVILRFTETSVATVGVLLGVVFLIAGLDEFFIAYVKKSWAWAHVLLGIFFVIGAIWAFASPFNAFWSLATAFGVLLILAGTMNIVESTVVRQVNPVWGLGLAVGILEILLGFWASQQVFATRAALLLLWVGLFALFRGIGDIVSAFQLRSHRND